MSLKDLLVKQREDFDETFINLMTIVIPVESRGEENSVNHKLVERTEEVKSFLLLSQKQIIEAVMEEVDKKMLVDIEIVPSHPRSYNKALQDVLSLLSTIKDDITN